jgi:iron uptake system EfeUOB component EfeO/EfeM
VVLGLAAVVAWSQPAGALSGSHIRHHTYGGTTHNSTRAIAAREAGVGATLAFSTTVGTAALGYGADLRALQAAVASGDLAGAKTDELAAQARYDALRFLAGTGPTTGWAVDGLAGQVPAGQHFAGLHLVERELWNGQDAAGAVAALVSSAPLVEAAFSRLQASPQMIADVAVDELGWVNEVAVPGRAEPYSHLDTIDVSAAVGTAQEAWDALAPLVRLVNPGPGQKVTRRLATLQHAVAALGPPGSVPDGALAPARLEQVAQDDDAVAASLSALGPTLAGYGPRQIYGYNA